MVRRTVILTLMVVMCWTSTVRASDADYYITVGRILMFDGSLSGLRLSYQTFDIGIDDSGCPDCSTNRELRFLHAVTQTAMLFIDNSNLSVNDSFLELAEEFGVRVEGDYFDFLDVNVPLTPDGCYDIPPGAPDADEVADIINNSIIPGIEDIIADLDSISDSPGEPFRIFFTPSETGLQNDLEVDYGEVLILKGLLMALKAQLQAKSAYDVFVDVDEAVIDNLLCSDFPNDLNINEDFLTPYPNFLKVLPTPGYPEDGAAILAQAKQDLVNAINYYFDAVNYIRSETDPQEDDLVYIDPNETFLLDAVNEKLTTLRDSLENDTIATYPAETTKTYNIYNSSSTFIGRLVLVYDFIGFEGEDGSLTFTDGTPSPWEIEWFGREDSSEIEVDVEYHSPSEWRWGYFVGTLSSDESSITGATFEYWGSSAWGTLNDLSGQLVSTTVVDVNVDLNPIFGNTTRYPDPVNPRDLLPQFDAENEPLAGTFGHGLGDNATLGGILPDMTQQDWSALFGLPTLVYRFWSPVNERHFYTIVEAEKDKLINLYAHVWTFESIAYYAFETDSEPGLMPVYRFWSPVLIAHFYTISESERDKLINIYPHVWTYEGIAFYAYPEGQQPIDTLPVYRFWSGTLETHFYTINETEKNKLIDNYPDVWTYEGIAWYAYDE